MHGNRNGLCVKLQTTISPYMIPIHYMTHKMNLAYKIIKNFVSCAKVEELVCDVHVFFSKSMRRTIYFQQFLVAATNGKKGAKTC